MRIGERGRSAGRGDQSLTNALDSLLRPVVEAALAVARETEDDEHAAPVPPALRPFLRFARLPARAISATRQVLETDDEFRARVAESTSEADVGRAGWLFLTRPADWERELARLADEIRARDDAADEAREERNARRKLAAVEEAARTAEQRTEVAREQAREASERLGEERRARRSAEDSVARLEARVAELEAVVAEARMERADAESATAAATDELERVRSELARERAEADAARAAPPVIDPAVVVAVQRAADAARHLADELASLAASVTPTVAVPPAESRAARPVRGEPRTPLLLPPGVHDDAPEAAEHLLRQRGVVLVVDGYNVTHAIWPNLDITEQRRRLVDALGELAARTGAGVEVVFDGAEGEPPPAIPATGRRLVRVMFSVPPEEADDVVVARAGQIPAHIPVVVASSDLKVQAGARRHGANVAGAPQLAAVLRVRR